MSTALELAGLQISKWFGGGKTNDALNTVEKKEKEEEKHESPIIDPRTLSMVKALDNLIKERAIDLANEKIDKVKSRTQQIAEEKEVNLDELVEKMAQIIIKDNEKYVGEEIAKQAIQEIKEGGNANEEKPKTTRGRKKKSTV